MVKKKVQAVARIRLNVYKIVERAVEEGVQYGWNRAHKHVEAPEPDFIQDTISEQVMEALDEVIRFDD